jgi:hypothetical protein
MTRDGFISGIQKGLNELKENDLDHDGTVTSAETKQRRKTEALTVKAAALVKVASTLE